jgi:hypothetical protein
VIILINNHLLHTLLDLTASGAGRRATLAITNRPW